MEDDEKTAAQQESASFPRGGRGPVVPAPQGSGIVLLLVSIAAVAAVIALMAWLLL